MFIRVRCDIASLGMKVVDVICVCYDKCCMGRNIVGCCNSFDVSVDVIDSSLSRFTNFRSTKLTISSCLIFVLVGKEETRKILNQITVDVVAIILISALFNTLTTV